MLLTGPAAAGREGERKLTLRKILLAVAVLALLVPAGVAQAAPVQEFSFQLKSVKKDGRFTVVFTSRSYDTTGAQPPLLTENYLRLPKGAVLAKTFLKSKYYCDAPRLLSTLQGAPEPGPFFKRLENLKATIRKIKSRASKKDLKNAKTCLRAQVGRGGVVVDARPLFNEPIPAKIFMYFAKAHAEGGVASFGIIGVPDETAAVVKANPIIANTRVATYADFVNDPTPDGLFGYKLVLPAGPIAGVRISIAEVNVTTTGLTKVTKKRTCIKRKKGKCVRRKTQRKVTFWFTRPTCPASGKLSFQSFYGYENGVTSTKQIELACPKFG
jgi:hypothetical protein